MPYTLLQTFYLSDLGIDGRVFQWNDLAVLHRAFSEKKTDEQVGPGSVPDPLRRKPRKTKFNWGTHHPYHLVA